MRVFPAKSLGAIGMLGLCAVAPLLAPWTASAQTASVQAGAPAEAERPAQAPSWVAPPKQPPSVTTAPRPDSSRQEKAAAARAGTIIVDADTCRWVQRHQPAADVEYKPGVDVQGRAVAPADLPGSGGVALPQTIEIGITVDLAERFGLPKTLYGSEAYLGTVTVDGNRVLFNGKPVTPDAEQELVALCSGRPVGR